MNTANRDKVKTLTQIPKDLSAWSRSQYVVRHFQEMKSQLHLLDEMVEKQGVGMRFEANAYGKSVGGDWPHLGELRRCGQYWTHEQMRDTCEAIRNCRDTEETSRDNLPFIEINFGSRFQELEGDCAWPFSHGVVCFRPLWGDEYCFASSEADLYNATVLMGNGTAGKQAFLIVGQEDGDIFELDSFRMLSYNDKAEEGTNGIFTMFDRVAGVLFTESITGSTDLHNAKLSIYDER